MKLKLIEEVARTALLNNDQAQPLREPGYLYFHSLRVSALCRWLCDKTRVKGVNRKILHVGALFHDVGKGRAHHALAGSKMIGELLPEALSVAEKTQVERLVREHNLRETPNKCDKDSKILQDADILDHYGAQGVWLSACITLRGNKMQQDMLDYVCSEQEKENIRLRHSQLNYAASKAEFKRRVSIQQNFFKRLRDETFVIAQTGKYTANRRFS